MKNRQIIIGSPVDYDQLVAYIRIGDIDLVKIDRDQGDDHLKIEFLETHDEHKGVSLDLLMNPIDQAKERLLSYDRV